jgi:ElaB/YqjD/DUF883 family membrane-anchored ribosome-binding protein
VDTDTTRPQAGTVPAATAEILDGLNDLLQLDHDAVGAYEIAMEKLQDRDHAAQIAGFLRDHERHIRELNELIAELGGEPKNHPHATGPFKVALQSLAGLAGDRGLLTAFRHNELQVRAKYDTYAAKANMWPNNIKRTVDRAALDEERHYRWVSDVMAAMGHGAGEGPELDATNAAREHMMVHGTRMDQVRDTVSDVADQARERAAEMAGQARSLAAQARDRAAELADQARERVRASGVADTVSARAGAVRNRLEGVLGGTPRADVYGGAALGDGDYHAPSSDPMTLLRERAHSVADGARGAGDEFEQRYQERPIQTLLIAGIAGFFIGRLLR